MYPSYMNKPTFMTNTANTGFGASTSSFGQPSANTSMFSSMQPSNIFQTPSTSSFNAGPSTQSSFVNNLVVGFVCWQFVICQRKRIQTSKGAFAQSAGDLPIDSTNKPS
ncbi:hypothetical protein Zmor_003237 [Zophobas morio]|uniref:Uncharacterized protein n=1 Tax=Zophobas morio TaxID=2755281 RepID=A0AA38M139_9CUCU|nr:hypothetical protein Zmor_003237 [Zophobas morio]